MRGKVTPDEIELEFSGITPAHAGKSQWKLKDKKLF